MATAAEFNKYRYHLHQLIKDPKNGILIDARNKVKSGGKVEHLPHAAFELTSGRLQRQYIVVAGLFRNRKWFDDCADNLARLARDIERIHHISFKALAVCSATAKHLMEHLHARLSTDRELEAHYYAMNPVQPEQATPYYNGLPVLLVTDVVATGDLCRDLAEQVEMQGGLVVGVLAIVATKDDVQDPDRTEIVLKNGSSIPFFFLCDFVLPPLGADEVDPERVEKVNPETLTHRLIADPGNGMLIDAREHDRLNSKPKERARNPVFELTSGVYQRQFVTAWGIFDKPWYFEACMDQLALLARRVRSAPDGWFSVIVTCTATGHHIMDHLQARIETAEDPVRVSYLGPFPFHGLRHRNLDLKDQRVLVATDVVAQGRMVKNILTVVEQLGGIPVAVIAIVNLVREEQERPRTKIEYISVLDKQGKSTAPRKAATPFHWLATYCIPEVREEDVDRIYRIDPNTILPVESFQNGFDPLISTEEALAHFEDSGALKVGFYGVGSRRLSAALRIPRLLHYAGAEIWSRICKYFDKHSVLVTTFGKADLAFRAFVERRAAQEWNSLESVCIPRSDSIDSDFPYFATREMRKRLKNKPIVLLLSSLQTSEKLRALVALLAQSAVKKITVICLINRMGAHTVEFVSRIKHLVHGLRQPGRAGDVNGVAVKGRSATFQFLYLYEVRDLHGEPLRRTIDTIDWLATQYGSSTSEQSYQSLTEQEVTRYLSVSSMTGRRFDQQAPTIRPGGDPGYIALGGKIWKYETLDGKLYAMFTYVAHKKDTGDIRDYRPIIREIARERQRPVLYMLYAILLSDISYLRLARYSVRLRRTLMRAVLKSRKQRMESERSFRLSDQKSKTDTHVLAERIAESVQTETYYLFGLALFCYMDDQRDAYRTFILDALTGGLASPEEWSNFPINLEQYYGNERILWCVSLLAHLAVPRTDVDYYSEFGKIAQQYRPFVKELKFTEYEPDEAKAVRAKLKHVWDSFVTDLGGHDPKQRHQIIRHLHSILIEPRENHILVVKDPKRAQDALQAHIEKIEEESGQRADTRLFSFEADKYAALKRTLEDAIHASAVLEGVAEATARLFSFHSIGGTDVTRYVAGLKSRTPGFRSQVHDLRRLFQKIRDDRKVAREQLEEIKTLRKTVEEELALSDSAILQALKWYVVELQPKLKSAMDQADLYLVQCGFSPFWNRISANFDWSKVDYVLVDPTLLKDVLWNLCTNVRHGLMSDGDPARQVEFGVDSRTIAAPLPDTDQVDAHYFWVESPFQDHQIKPNDTLWNQRLSIAQYGGKLEFTADHERNRFRAELQLISRNGTHERWRRRFPDAGDSAS